MKRPGRLVSARSWLPNYTGKNILRGYCKRFCVDWRCALVVLGMLGVKIDPAYLARRESTEAEKTRQRAERKQLKETEEASRSHPYIDPFSAYLSGDYAAFNDLEQQQAAANDEDLDRWDIPF